MEDSFKVRVDKIFGTLASNSSAPSSSLSSLWSLTDDEIERREWNRDKDIPEPEDKPSGILPGLPKSSEKNPMEDVSEMEKDLDDLDDDRSGESEPESSKQLAKPDDFNDEEWEIKQSIGTDCTLDFEAEEDEYDRVAVGNLKDGDHMYMNDILGYGIDIDSCNVLPNSFKEVSRDPRANHIAAKFRLKEDAEAEKKVDSLRIIETDEPHIADVHNNDSQEEATKPKSILKRKDNQVDPKSKKRVHFDPECRDNYEEESEGAKNVSMVTVSSEASFSAQDFSSALPDYIQNPSRYTHYTFDSLSDVDEESNRQAYMDFLKLVNRSNPKGSSLDDEYEDLPAVTFIPRRKLGDAMLVQDCSDTNQSSANVSTNSMHGRALPLPIAAEVNEDEEICAMDEDEPEAAIDRKIGSNGRLNRQYRHRTKGWQIDDR